MLITRYFFEVRFVELVVLDYRVPIATDILAGHFFGAICALVNKCPARDIGRRWLSAIRISVNRPIILQFLPDGLPRFLGNHENADTHFRHDARRVRRYCGRIRPTFKRRDRTGADISALLMKEFARVFDPALFEGVQDDFCGLFKPKSGRAHIDTEAVKLDSPGSAAHPQNHTAV